MKPGSRKVARWAVAVVVVAIGGAADDFRPAPRFEGKGLPDPPRQNQPWAPPATTLPRFLVSATQALFDQGLADPRDGDYREIEVGVGSVWGGEAGIVRTRGWVLPAKGGEKARFAVSWSGLVYPVVSVGEPANLEADVLALEEVAGNGRADVAPGDRAGRMREGFNPFGSNSEVAAVSPTTLLPIKVCLLLRLGRADLAETVWAAGLGLPRKPDPAQPRPKLDLTTYGISYLSLAADWSWYRFDRAVCAHMRGDDALALADARALDASHKAIVAHAEAMGFPRPNRGLREGEAGPYIEFLGQLPDLLADHERRAAEVDRPAVPPRGGDRSARIAALIRDLDRVAARQWGQPGGVSLGEAPTVQALIAEGDDAVEPLIEALRRDTRLTRSVHFHRDFFRHRTIMGTHEAAYTALSGILKTPFFEAGSTGDDLSARGNQGREAVAARVQAYWDKYKAVPLVERWYRILADDRSSPSAWLGAAGNIVQPENVTIVPGSTVFVETVTTPTRPGDRPRLRGEPLRVGHAPTVSELMARRFDAMLGGPDFPGPGLDGACSMASMLNAWDPPDSLSRLREASRLCRQRYDGPNNGHDWRNQQLGVTIARFALARARSGDPEAFRDYVDWLGATRPEWLETNLLPALEPLYRRPDVPELAQAAERLFLDPKSPWVPLIRIDRPNSGYHAVALLSSPMVGVPAFRRMLVAALGDRSRAGDVVVDEGSIQMHMDSGWQSNRGHDRVDPLKPQPGAKMPFRIADLYAGELASIEGAPDFEIYWPEPRRDAALAEMIAFLGRFGPSLVHDESLNGHFHHFPHPGAHLSFPMLDHPADRAEVDRGLAIFSDEGAGDRRIVPLIDRPLKANWVTLKDYPYIPQPIDPATGPKVEYHQSGHVWQAEEVRIDGQWRRFYGFIGRHVVARVPAEEVEFTEWPFGGWWRLSDGLDATFFGPYDPTQPDHPIAAGVPEPGSPRVVALRLRNRSGFDRPTPTEFVRKEGGRVVGLRRGLELAIERTPYLPGKPNNPALGRFDDRKWEDVPPRARNPIAPGTEARILRPAEVLAAFEFDLNDLFDLSRPGLYRMSLVLSKESGVAEGAFREQTFAVGDPGDPAPKARPDPGNDSLE